MTHQKLKFLKYSSQHNKLQLNECQADDAGGVSEPATRESEVTLQT